MKITTLLISGNVSLKTRALMTSDLSSARTHVSPLQVLYDYSEAGNLCEELCKVLDMEGLYERVDLGLGTLPADRDPRLASVSMVLYYEPEPTGGDEESPLLLSVRAQLPEEVEVVQRSTASARSNRAELQDASDSDPYSMYKTAVELLRTDSKVPFKTIQVREEIDPRPSGWGLVPNTDFGRTSTNTSLRRFP